MRETMTSDSVNLGSNPSSPATDIADVASKSAAGQIGHLGQDVHSARTNPGTAHTPGPWSSISADGYSRIIAGNSEFAGIVVYNTNGFSPSDEERVFFETRAANARLIAAAPELLVSLTDLLRYLDDHDWGTVPEGATADRARAAIAKATGASHV